MSQDSNSQNSTPESTGAKTTSPAELLLKLEKAQLKSDIPTFRVGDSVKVHAKIREGGKERVQIFEGVVIRRNKGSHATANFTVRKISYNIGVERTFLLHAPTIEKIEVVSIGEVRRARLYYLRNLRGKSARIKSQLVSGGDSKKATSSAASSSESTSSESSAASSSSPLEAGQAQ